MCPRPLTLRVARQRSRKQSHPGLPPSADPRASKQFLLLAHLYAKTDARSLEFLRSKLMPPRYSALQLSMAAGVGVVLAGGVPLPPTAPPRPLLLPRCPRAFATPPFPLPQLQPSAPDPPHQALPPPLTTQSWRAC
jgi:hypothetical protein